MDRITGSGRCCYRLVSESMTHHSNKPSPLGDSLGIAHIIGKATQRTCEVNRVQHGAHEPGRLVHRSAGNFKFWFLDLQQQLTILVFVRSIRAANFPLYIQSLMKLAHWFFTFDHYHYVRWISFHPRDMMTLSHFHPHV